MAITCLPLPWPTSRGRTLVDVESTVVLVTNPVDVLTQVMAEASGPPR